MALRSRLPGVATNWDYILRDIIIIVLCVIVLVALADGKAVKDAS